MNRGLFFSLVLLLCVAPWGARARVQSLTVEHDERAGFLLGSFGYWSGGVLELVLRDMELMVQHNFGQRDTYNISFVLQRSLYSGAARVLGNCELATSASDYVFPLASRARWNYTAIKQEIAEPGLYNLYFSNCEEETTVSFRVEWTDYNVDGDGRPIFLSAGESNLPTLFVFFCLCFVVALGFWANECRTHRENVKAIHWLMASVIACKILNLFFEALKFHSIKTTGDAHGWNIPFHIFSFLKGMLLFTVIALIGTGWSIVRPFLTDRDKKIIITLLSLQVVFNISAVVLEEESTGSYGWLTWRDIFYVFDMIACAVIVVPVLWSIQHLKEAAEVDGKAARNLEKLRRFRRFYLLVLAFIYFTRFIVWILNATLAFDRVWVAYAFAEGSALAFYWSTGYLFRPVAHNPYLLVDADDDDGREAMGAPDDNGDDLEAERIQMTELSSGKSKFSIDDDEEQGSDSVVPSTASSSAPARALSPPHTVHIQSSAAAAAAATDA